MGRPVHLMDTLRDLQAVQARHHQTHDQHVRPQALREPHRFLTVTRFAEKVKPGGFTQQGYEALSDDGMADGDNDRYAWVASCSSFLFSDHSANLNDFFRSSVRQTGAVLFLGRCHHSHLHDLLSYRPSALD